jgi:formate dehydrogenase
MSIRDKLTSGPLGFGAAPLGNRFRNIPEEDAAATVDAARQQGTQGHRLPAALEQELGLTFHADVASVARACDVISLHCPLHPGSRHVINDTVLKGMKRGSYSVNTARAELCDRDEIVRELEGGQFAGYAGDVWFPKPPPKDHSWRTMPHHAMTPHVSGTTLSAPARYAAGTREILECWFDGLPIRDEYLIVAGWKLAGTGARSYTVGDARKAAARK